MIKFAIVEDSLGRRVVSNYIKTIFTFENFSYIATNEKWISKEAIDSYCVKQFSRKKIVLEKIPNKNDFALEISSALKNYGFSGVLTISNEATIISR
jgi:hypothetical protein